MSAEDTERFLAFVAYVLAALILVFMGYLLWRKYRRRRHRHKHIRPRSQQHRGTWGVR